MNLEQFLEEKALMRTETEVIIVLAMVVLAQMLHLHRSRPCQSIPHIGDMVGKAVLVAAAVEAQAVDRLVSSEATVEKVVMVA
jgi:hypothetical protein